MKRYIHAASNSGSPFALNAGDWVKIRVDGKDAIGVVEHVYYSDDYPGRIPYNQAVRDGFFEYEIAYLFTDFDNQNPDDPMRYSAITLRSNSKDIISVVSDTDRKAFFDEMYDHYGINVDPDDDSDIDDIIPDMF